MSPEEWKALLRAAQAAGSQTYALILLLYDACLRASEVGKVKLEHCRYLGRRQFYTPRSKGGRAGWIDLTPLTAEVVTAWINEKYPVLADRRPELPLFTTGKKYGRGEQPMNRFSVYRIVSMLGEEAQIPPAIAHPHAIRHGFIMHCLSRAQQKGISAELLLPKLAPRVGHRIAWTTINNYISETAGAKKVIDESVLEMVTLDDD